MILKFMHFGGMFSYKIYPTIIMPRYMENSKSMVMIFLYIKYIPIALAII